MNLITRAYRAAKSFVMRWSGQPSWSWGGLARTRYDYASNVDTAGSSLVMACVLWLARTLPEAPLRLRERVRGGNLDPRPDHALLAILARPNPYYSGELLWMATLADWVISGNAYWLKVRSGGNRVVELWWVPAGLVEPKYPDDGSQYLTHYEYRPGAVPIRVETTDVVHFRYGLDPKNPRKGLSPLASAMREVWTDEEAALFGASLLRNLGVPGVVIAPDSDDVDVTQDEADATKARFTASFGGDNRGAPLVMRGKTKVTVLSFSPDQMNLDLLRRLPEERITALIGIPAIVVGFGAGLARSTFANYAEAREAAYEGNVIPTQRLLAAEITGQLLPEFGDPARLVLDFDHSQVRVLQPDQDRLHARLDVAVRGGWMFPNEARERVGLDPVPGGDVLYVPIGVMPTDPAMLIPPEPEPVPAPLALPEPDEQLALPAPKGYGQKGSAENLAAGMTRLRARHRAPLARSLGALLERDRERVVAALLAQEKARGTNGHGPIEHKAISWRDVFDAVAHEAGLRRLLEQAYRRVLGAVHSLTEDALGTSFDLDDPATRRYLAEAGSLIKDISEHTRLDIARALQDGQALGEGIPQLATRIEELTAFNRARAETIARTELGASSNSAALASYEASGVVVGVRIFDGHDDEPCRSLNGRTVTLGVARGMPRLNHPRCTMALGAIVDAAEMEKARAQEEHTAALVEAAGAARRATERIEEAERKMPVLTPPAVRVRRDVTRDADGRVKFVTEHHEGPTAAPWRKTVRKTLERDGAGLAVAVVEEHEEV